MAWIEEIPEAEGMARGDKLARLYKALLVPEHGVVENVLKVHGIIPETLDGHLRLYRSIMHTPRRLSRREKEGMAVAVSAANECHY